MKVLEIDDTNSIFITRIKNVKNMSEMKGRLLSGQLKCGLLKPQLFLDPVQLVLASYIAVQSQQGGCMKTKNVYTETIFNLSPSTNITKSLAAFGSAEDDIDVIVFCVGKSEDDLKECVSQFDGSQCDDFEDVGSVNEIKRLYKISGNESSVSSLLNSVLSRISTKICC